MTNKVRKITAIIASIIISISCMMAAPTTSASAAQYDLNEMANEMLVLVNEAREEAGMAPLYMVDHLNDIARDRARDIIFVISHRRPDGSIFTDYIDRNRVNYNTFAENLAWGKSSPEEAFAELMNSPEHRANILNPEYTHVGIGVTYEQNSTYGWYWTQLFVSVNGNAEGQRMVTRANLALAPSKANTQAAPAGYGDINCDGCYNSFDVIAVTNYIFGKVELNELQLQSCDVYADGEINIADVIVLRRYVLGQYESLPITPDMFN